MSDRNRLLLAQMQGPPSATPPWGQGTSVFGIPRSPGRSGASGGGGGNGGVVLMSNRLMSGGHPYKPHFDSDETDRELQDLTRTLSAMPAEAAERYLQAIVESGGDAEMYAATAVAQRLGIRPPSHRDFSEPPGRLGDLSGPSGRPRPLSRPADYSGFMEGPDDVYAGTRGLYSDSMSGARPMNDYYDSYRRQYGR